MSSCGKSGQLFYYTHDKNYMMKTLPEREFDSLMEILPHYYSTMKENPNSLISRFYGLHRIVWTDHEGKKQIRYLVVMNNVFKSFNVGLKFDLKGSTAKRTTLKGDMTIDDLNGDALKDNDFTKLRKCLELMDN